MSAVSYSISTASNLPSDSPWKLRKTTTSSFSTRQLRGNHTDAWHLRLRLYLRLRLRVSNGFPSSFVEKVTKTRNSSPGRGPVTYFKSTAFLPYVKGASELLRRCLQQQGIRAVFKSETTITFSTTKGHCQSSQIGQCGLHDSLWMRQNLHWWNGKTYAREEKRTRERYTFSLHPDLRLDLTWLRLDLRSDLIIIIITVTVLQKRISISKLIHFKIKYLLF